MSRFSRFTPLFALVLTAVIAVAGCSEDPMEGTGGGGATELAQADIDPSLGDFDLTVDSAGDSARPFPGPFVIRGRNVHYDETLDALVVDLSVVNRSRTAYPEPVGLTFVRLMPEGVEVLNPDNDIHGPGAAIVFEFANDDAMWTPGEESLPRQVQFAAAGGRAAAFVARIDIGPHEHYGTIGGLVWNDIDADGFPDPDEPPIAGAVITMTHGEFEVLYRTRSNERGLYRFTGLGPGLYTVTKQPGDCRPTTPTSINVILTDTDDEGPYEFFKANFGCRTTVPPDSAFVEVGDYVTARGRWDDRPMAPFAPALFARMLLIDPCSCDELPCPGVPCPGPLLAGPVTGINRERRALQVMGTWAHVPPEPETPYSIDFDDVELRDRIWVALHDVPGGEVPVVTAMEPWTQPDDVAIGEVKRVYTCPECYGPPTAFWVYNTRVELSTLTSDPGKGP